MKTDRKTIRICFIIGISAILFMGCAAEKAELKRTVFELAVNTEPSTAADYYFKDIQEGNVTFPKDVCTAKTGDVKTTITFDEHDYEITLRIVDKEAPVIELMKDTFTFDIGTDVKTVNEAINREIKIKDNYDTKFPAIKVIDSVYSTPQELKKKLTVEDTSGNKAKEVDVTITFVEKKSSSSGSEETKSSIVDAGKDKANSNKQSSSNPNNGSSNKKPSTSGNKSSKPSYDSTWENPDGSCHHKHYQPASGTPWFNSGDSLDQWVEEYCFEHPEAAGRYGVYECPHCGKLCVHRFYSLG